MKLGVMLFVTREAIAGMRFDTETGRVRVPRVSIYGSPRFEELTGPQRQSFGDLIYQQDKGEYVFFDGNHWSETGDVREVRG